MRLGEMNWHQYQRYCDGQAQLFDVLGYLLARIPRDYRAEDVIWDLLKSYPNI